MHQESLDTKSILIILFSVTLFMLFATWMASPAPPVGFRWDDTWYLMMAEWISGNNETRELSWVMLTMRQYPPLWSFVISLTGADLSDQSLAFLLNAVLLALGAGISMAWFRSEGFSIPAMVIASLFLVINPVALIWLASLFSEHLFIALSISSLALAFAYEKKPRVWLIIGLLAGLSVATRSAGLALVAGMFMYLVISRRPAEIIFFLAGLAIGLIPIEFFTVGLESAPTYSSRVFEILRMLNLDYLLNQLDGILLGWVRLWGSRLGALMAGLTVLPGLYLRLRDNRPDAWYALTYFGMLILWPYPDHMARFLWPLLPVFIVAAHSFLKSKLLPINPNWGSLVLVNLVLVLSVPDGIGRTMNRLMDPLPKDLQQLSRSAAWTTTDSRATGTKVISTRKAFLDDMRRIKTLTEGDSCIFTELPALVAVNTQRVSWEANWRVLKNLDSKEFLCSYYYLIPEQVKGADQAELVQFESRYRVLFKTMAPSDPTGKKVLAVFYRLK